MPDKLIPMEKDGERIFVHPLSVSNHRELGWKVVEDEQSAKAAAVENPAMIPPAEPIKTTLAAPAKKRK